MVVQSPNQHAAVDLKEFEDLPQSRSILQSPPDQGYVHESGRDVRYQPFKPQTALPGFLRPLAGERVGKHLRNKLEPVTTVSGQLLSSRMTAKANMPNTGPSPTDNGTNTSDLVPYARKFSRSQACFWREVGHFEIMSVSRPGPSAPSMEGIHCIQLLNGWQASLRLNATVSAAAPGALPHRLPKVWTGQIEEFADAALGVFNLAVYPVSGQVDKVRRDFGNNVSNFNRSSNACSACLRLGDVRAAGIDQFPDGLNSIPAIDTCHLCNGSGFQKKTNFSGIPARATAFRVLSTSSGWMNSQ